MQWSFPIGRIAGSELRIHLTFFLLLLCGFGGGLLVALLHCDKLFSRPVEPCHRVVGAGNGGFLFNGGRAYVDMGHLEYCTPECLSLRDLLIYDRAGDLLAQPLLPRLAAMRSSERPDHRWGHPSCPARNRRSASTATSRRSSRRTRARPRCRGGGL